MAVMNCETGLCPNDDDKYQLDLDYDYYQFGGTLSECKNMCLKRSECTGIEWRNENDSSVHCKFWYQNACTRGRQAKQINSSFTNAWTCDKATYSFGQPSTQECPDGFMVLVSVEECKTAATALNLDFGLDWNPGQNTRPKGCYQDPRTSALFYNKVEIGSPHAGSRLVCQQEDIAIKKVKGRWHRISSKHMHVIGEVNREGAEEVTIFVDTYIGANKTQNRKMNSQTWSDAVRATASAKLALGNSGEYIEGKVARGFADKFKEDWSKNDLIRTRVPYKVMLTDELREKN